MVILLVGMAVVARYTLWNALPHLHAQVVGHVAADGKLTP